MVKNPKSKSQTVLGWVSEHLSLGGLIRHAAGAAGTVINCCLKVVGHAVEKAGGDSKMAKGVGRFCKGSGEVLDTAITETGKVAGKLTNKAVELAGKGTGTAAGFAAEKMGCEPETVKTMEKVGDAVGRMGVGLAVGCVVSDIATGAAAAQGLHGAAQTTSGLANLGHAVTGGASGMGAGQVVVNGIAAAGTASGAVTGADVRPEEGEESK